MELIKSIRVRNRKNNLDIRVNLYLDKNKYILNGTNGKEGTTQMRVIWTNLQISTKGKYSNYTNDELIKEFIDINSKRENADYDIIQDPWLKEPPNFRNFGFDPYYLNNGSEVYISWSWLDGVTEINDINITNIEPGGLKWSDDKGNELKIPKSIENANNSLKYYIRKKIKVKNSYRNTAGNLISEEFKIDKNGSLSKSEEKDYDGTIEDIDIINELISLWKIKVPNYESLRLCSPDNKVCYFSSGDNVLQGIKYISPIEDLQQTESQDNQSVSQDPIDDKINLSFQIDSTLNIKPREDFNFKIFIGEPPVDPLLAGFDFGEDEQDLSLLDDEFIEADFVGMDESQLEMQEYPDEKTRKETEDHAFIINQAPYVPGKNKLDLIPGEFLDNNKRGLRCCQINGVPVNVNIADPLIDMIQAAKNDGISLRVSSGFRPGFNPSINTKSESGISVSASSQELLWQQNCAGRQKCKTATAKAGTSRHGNGIAIDFNTGTRCHDPKWLGYSTNSTISKMTSTTEKNYQWLVKNSWRFGFLRTLATEEWHFEYWPEQAKKGPYGKLPKTDKLFYADLGLNNIQISIA
jgi:hypothetical protein